VAGDAGPRPFGYSVAHEEASVDVATFGLRRRRRVIGGHNSAVHIEIAGLRRLAKIWRWGANPRFKSVQFRYNGHNKR
jgi:hypothetical protein